MKQLYVRNSGPTIENAVPKKAKFFLAISIEFNSEHLAKKIANVHKSSTVVEFLTAPSLSPGFLSKIKKTIRFSVFLLDTIFHNFGRRSVKDNTTNNNS